MRTGSIDYHLWIRRCPSFLSLILECSPLYDYQIFILDFSLFHLPEKEA